MTYEKKYAIDGIICFIGLGTRSQVIYKYLHAGKWIPDLRHGYSGFGIRLTGMLFGIEYTVMANTLQSRV